MSDQRILFMGTPEFACGTLNALVEAGLDVAGVVTAPDKPAGRGRQLRESAVKIRARELGLPILQPERLKDPAFLEALDGIGASLYVVVAFRMLPEMLWNRPKHGTVNLHASLLPDYRGAAPINWAVINGEERTGVTTFKLRHEIDTGDILLQEELPIGEEETAGELHDRMMRIGATLMVRTVRGLFSNTLVPMPQQEGVTHAAPKLTPENCRIDWTADAHAIHNLVRGLSPFPGAWTTWNSDDAAPLHFKILRARPAAANGAEQPGFVRIADGRILISTNTGWMEAMDVQPEGKRRMDAASFARGLRNTNGVHVV
ncbi:MAG: methionyl-tRNA formyltransferase [Flavobacteriales bacterium]